MKDSLLPIYRAVQLWSDADGMRMAAAMSFYGILSLAPPLVSLALSTLLNIFSGWASASWLPLEPVMLVLNEVVAFAVCAALFVGLMRMSAGPKPRTRFLVLGACVGAALFSIGRHVLAAYLSTAAVVSAYGAAGSLVVLLMWIYFSSAVLLLSAGCARALDEERCAKSKAATAATLKTSISHRPWV